MALGLAETSGQQHTRVQGNCDLLKPIYHASTFWVQAYNKPKMLL